MLKDTRDFYDKTRLDDVAMDQGGEVPVAYTHVFHKEYRRLPKVPLPEGSRDGEFDELLRSRKSIREFSDQSMTLQEAANILRSCGIVDRERDPERRTYPSAGARFPIEIYLLAHNIEGLDRGAYHYNQVGEELEQLWKTDLREREKELTSPFVDNSAASVALTSVISRSEVKYGHKAYPFSLMEAGHIGQNLQLAATREDIGSCPIGGFVNKSLEQILDLTEDEIPLYTMALGKV